MAKMNPLNTVTRKCSSDFASKQPKMPEYYQSKKTNVSGPELCTKINKKNTPPFSLWCAKQEIDTKGQFLPKSKPKITKISALPYKQGS